MRNTNEQIEQAIIELIEFEVKILESVETLKKLELLNDTNTKTYEKECEQALLYSIKEDRILNNIDCLPFEFEECIKEIIFNIGIYLPEEMSEIQKQDIEAKLARILGSKCKELVQNHTNDEDYDENEFEVIDFPTDFYGLDDTYEAINNQIEMQRLIFIQKFIDNATNNEVKKEAIEEKFRLIYENKEIIDNLLNSNMNPYFLFETPDDVIAKSLEMNNETFQAQKKEQIKDNISNFIDYFDTEEIEDINDMNQIMNNDCDLAFIYYLLNTLPTPDLSDYLVEYQSEYKEDKQQYKLIINMINDSLKERKDYKKPSSELSECKTCFAISEELFKKFSSLIKLSELIIDKFSILCELEKQNLKQSEDFGKHKKELASYLEFEKEIIDAFDFSIQESDTLTDILENHLDLLLKNTNNKGAIKKRIGSMIPDLIDDFSAVAYEEEVTFTIHQTFITKTLKKFDEIIQKETNIEIKNKLIEEKYLQYSYNQCINQDLISTNFTPSEISLLDENTIIDLLEIHDFEYGYDKNVELYVIGNAIIHEIINNDKKYFSQGYITYRKICLEEILKNLNVENILDLECQYNIQIKQTDKNQKVENKFKIKTIFKKAKPEYLK